MENKKVIKKIKQGGMYCSHFDAYFSIGDYPDYKINAFNFYFNFQEVVGDIWNEEIFIDGKQFNYFKNIDNPHKKYRIEKNDDTIRTKEEAYALLEKTMREELPFMDIDSFMVMVKNKFDQSLSGDLLITGGDALSKDNTTKTPQEQINECGIGYNTNSLELEYYGEQEINPIIK